MYAFMELNNIRRAPSCPTSLDVIGAPPPAGCAHCAHAVARTFRPSRPAAAEHVCDMASG